MLRVSKKLSGYTLWFQNIGLPFIGQYKGELMRRHQTKKFENFDELYNFLALSTDRHALVISDVVGNRYRLNYIEDGFYEWKPVTT